jgi:hypothetical protein
MPEPIIEAWTCDECGEEYHDENEAYECESRHKAFRHGDMCIVLMTSRTDEQNARIEVLSSNDEPTSDLTKVKTFRKSECQAWIAANRKKWPAWHLTLAPAKSPGVPAFPV